MGMTFLSALIGALVGVALVGVLAFVLLVWERRRRAR